MHEPLVELKAFIEDLGEVIETFIFTPYGQLRIGSFSKRTYYYKLEKFKSAGLLKHVKTVHGRHYALSEKAKRLLKTIDNTPKRTDGLWTIVTFDIPVAKNRERTIFRRYLQKNGFTLIQRSLLISPNRLGMEIEKLARELKLESCVKIISGRVDKSML